MERNTKEAATNNETRKHIANVAKFANILIRHLQNRVMEHDATKMESPELESFTEYTSLLKDSTYGSKEYNERLAGVLKPALDHHYAKNRHHPEHWEHGVDDMDLVDLIEMFCDWKSATLRHNDGNLLKSIDHNANRFKLSPQLVGVFKNTARLLENEGNKG